MPEMQHEDEAELVENFAEFKPDYEALYRLSLSQDFQALVAVMRAKAKSARRKLDDFRTDTMQSVGFCRGRIWVIKDLYREICRAKDEVLKARQNKKSGGK